jgi:hypothetical protein
MFYTMESREYERQHIPNSERQSRVFLLHIREIASSNLGPETVFVVLLSPSGQMRS